MRTTNKRKADLEKRFELSPFEVFGKSELFRQVQAGFENAVRIFEESRQSRHYKKGFDLIHYPKWDKWDTIKKSKKTKKTL